MKKSVYGLGNIGSVMFWGIYILVGIAAWWHTYSLYAIKDPPFIAATSALAVDGMLMFTLYVIGRTYGDQKKTGLIGIFVFAVISTFAQVASRNYGRADILWVPYVVDYLLPATITMSILLLGGIKYFDQNSDGVPDFMESKNKQGQQPQFQPRPAQENRQTEYKRNPEDVRPVPPRQPQQAFPAHRPVPQNGRREESHQTVETNSPPLPKLSRDTEGTDRYQSE